jgi:DNA-binding beta-propeller fold protein YncE
MRRFWMAAAALIATAGFIVSAQDGPYKVQKTVKVGGAGGFDYVYADEAGRRLYIARTGQTPRITVFNLDTLEPAGEIAGSSAHGAAVSSKSHRGFGSSKPVVMWDTETMKEIKKIDPFNDRIWVFSHRAPNATVINAADGAVVGTVDLGGAPEQAVTDGKGRIYVDIEDKDNIAVVDAKTLAVTAHYDLQGKGGTCAGLAFDVKNQILFASCHKPQTMVVMSAKDGKILETLPIGNGTDGAVFNPKTMEAFSSQSDGTLSIIKEKSPTSFEVEQNLQTMRGARTLTLDSKTNHVLLITAEYAPPPENPPPTPAGGRGPRPQMIPDSFSILVVGK